MAETEKYKKVRGMLDSLKFLGTLHPDSVSLVDSLLKELMKITGKCTELQRKVKEANSVRTPKSGDDSDQKIDYLNQKTYELEKENKKLLEQIRSSENQQELSKLQKKITEIQLKYGNEIEDYVRKIQYINVKMEEHKCISERLMEQNSKLKEKIESKVTEFNQCNGELTKIIESKSKEIQSISESLSRLRIGNMTLQSHLDDANEKIQSFSKNQNQSMSSTNTINVLKDEIKNLEARVQSLQIQFENEQTEKEKLKREEKRLKDKIAALEDSEVKAAQMGNISENNISKLEKMYQESQELLSIKVRELEEQEGREKQNLREIERQSNKIKDQAKKVNFLQESLNKVNEEFNITSTRLNEKTKESRESENKRIGLERRIQELESLQRVQEEEAIKSQSSRDKKSVFSNESVETIKLTFEQEIKLLRKEIQIMKQNEHQIVLQKEKVSIENQKLQRIITEGNKQVESAQVQKEALLKQNKSLKDALQGQSDTGFETRNEVIRLQEKADSLEIFIDELKSINKQQTNQKAILEQEILSLEKELSEEKMSKKDMYEDNKQLVVQVKSLEGRKEELYSKLKQLQEQNSVRSSANVEYKTEFLDLKDKFNALTKELQRRDMDIINIDSERDQAVNDLDKKCEELERVRTKLEQYESEIRSTNKGLSDYELNINQMARQIADYESERGKYEQDFALLEAQLKEAKEELYSVKSDYKRIENELQLILMGRKENERESERLRNKLKDIESKKSTRDKDYDEEREKAASLAIINKELKEELKTEIQETKRLGLTIEDFERENHKMYETLCMKDRQLDQLAQALQELEFKEAQLLQEVTHYDKKVLQLSDELDSKCRQLEEVLIERDAFKAESSWKKQGSSSAMTQQLSDSNWREAYQTKNDQLKQQYELKKKDNDKLRLQNRELEAIINDLRRELFLAERNRGPEEKSHQESMVSDYRSAANRQNKARGNANYEEEGRLQETPIKNIMSESLVEERHLGNLVNPNNESANSENINSGNVEIESDLNNKTLPIYSESNRKLKDYVSGYGSQSDQQSDAISSQVSYSSKGRYDRHLELQAKYISTMK